MKKTCIICKQILPIENFSMVGDKYGNRRARCKPCYNEQRQRSNGTWEKYQKEKAYVEELHALQKEGKKRCRSCNEIKPLDKFPNDYRSSCFYNKKSYCSYCAKEKWQKPWRQLPESRAKKSGYDKKYRSKPESKEKVRKNQNKRYHNDPAHKLKVLMRGRLNKVLDRKKQSKRFTQELGCTFDELVVHLESQFYNDPKTGEVMTWDNHTMDGWHVDHKKPLYEFNLYDDEQFKEAAHYTNLQPLWWWENLEKNRGIFYGKETPI